MGVSCCFVHLEEEGGCSAGILFIVNGTPMFNHNELQFFCTKLYKGRDLGTKGAKSISICRLDLLILTVRFFFFNWRSTNGRVMMAS